MSVHHKITVVIQKETNLKFKLIINIFNDNQKHWDLSKEKSFV